MTTTKGELRRFDPLATLAAAIRAAHTKAVTAATSAIEHAITAGRLLSEAKGQVNPANGYPGSPPTCRR